jgi:hypothetical protein
MGCGEPWGVPNRGTALHCGGARASRPDGDERAIDGWRSVDQMEAVGYARCVVARRRLSRRGSGGGRAEKRVGEGRPTEIESSRGGRVSKGRFERGRARGGG